MIERAIVGQNMDYYDFFSSHIWEIIIWTFLLSIIALTLKISWNNYHNLNIDSLTTRPKTLKEIFGSWRSVAIFFLSLSLAKLPLMGIVYGVCSFILVMLSFQIVLKYILSLFEQRGIDKKDYSIYNKYMCKSINFTWLILMVVILFIIYTYNPLQYLWLSVINFDTVALYANGLICLINNLFKILEYNIGTYNGINQLTRRHNYWINVNYKNNTKMLVSSNWNSVSKFLPIPTFIQGVNKNVVFTSLLLEANNGKMFSISPNIISYFFNVHKEIKLNSINYINNNLYLNINYINMNCNIVIKNVALDIKNFFNSSSYSKQHDFDISKLPYKKEIFYKNIGEFGNPKNFLDKNIVDFENMLKKDYNNRLIENLIKNTNKDLQINMLRSTSTVFPRPEIDLISMIDNVKERYALDPQFTSELYNLYSANPILLIHKVKPETFVICSDRSIMFRDYYYNAKVAGSSLFLPYHTHIYHDKPLVLFQKYERGFLPKIIIVGNPVKQTEGFCTSFGTPFVLPDQSDYTSVFSRDKILPMHYMCNGVNIKLPWSWFNPCDVNSSLVSGYSGKDGVIFMKKVRNNFYRNLEILDKAIPERTSRFFAQAYNFINQYPLWRFNAASLQYFHITLEWLNQRNTFDNTWCTFKGFYVKSRTGYIRTENYRVSWYTTYIDVNSMEIEEKLVSEADRLYCRTPWAQEAYADSPWNIVLVKRPDFGELDLLLANNYGEINN